MKKYLFKLAFFRTFSKKAFQVSRFSEIARFIGAFSFLDVLFVRRCLALSLIKKYRFICTSFVTVFLTRVLFMTFFCVFCVFFAVVFLSAIGEGAGGAVMVISLGSRRSSWGSRGGRGGGKVGLVKEGWEAEELEEQGD